MLQNNEQLPHGLLRIKTYYSSLKPAERKVADFLLDHRDEFIHSSITKVAQGADVSEATVVKFCQRLGYTGYQEMKIMFASSKEGEETTRIYSEMEAGDSIQEIIGKIFSIYSQSFHNTKELLKKGSIEEAVEVILKAQRIFFLGFGASGIVAKDGELKFQRIGYTVRSLTDNHEQKTVGALLSSEDLVVAISDSGRTKELLESLSIIKETGAFIIAITSNFGSPVTNLSSITLFTSSQETPFRGSALASRMAQLAVIDVLFLGVATKRFDQTLKALEKTRKAMEKSKLP